MEELSKAVVSRHPKVIKIFSVFFFSIMMILMTEGITEKYYKPSTNLDAPVDVSYGH